MGCILYAFTILKPVILHIIIFFQNIIKLKKIKF